MPVSTCPRTTTTGARRTSVDRFFSAASCRCRIFASARCLALVSSSSLSSSLLSLSSSSSLLSSSSSSSLSDGAGSLELSASFVATFSDESRQNDRAVVRRVISSQRLVAVERGSSAVECRTRNQVSPGSNHPLLPFRRLGIFVLSIDAPVHSAV